MFNPFWKKTELTLRKKADRIFIQIAILMIFLTGGVVALFIRFYKDIYLVAQFLSGKIHSACGCLASFPFSAHPVMWGLIFSGAFLLFLVLLYIIVSIASLHVRTGRFVRKNLRYRKKNISNKLFLISFEMGIEGKIIELNSKNPVVFCFGLLKPKICIASSLVKHLSEKELRAVLLHEKSHLEAREPAKLFFIKTVYLLFLFIPNIKFLAKKYLTFSELSADEAATDGFKNKIHLAQALHKIIGWEQKQALNKLVVLSFFSAVLGERVMKLTDDAYVPSSKWLTARTLVGVFSTVLVLFGVNFFFSSNNIQKTFHVHTLSSSCEMENQPMTGPVSINSCLQEQQPNECAITYANPQNNQC